MVHTMRAEEGKVEAVRGVVKSLQNRDTFTLPYVEADPFYADWDEPEVGEINTPIAAAEMVGGGVVATQLTAEVNDALVAA